MTKARYERSGFRRKGRKWLVCQSRSLLGRCTAASNKSAFVKELENDLAGVGRAPVCRSVLADQASERVDRRRAFAVLGGFAVGSDGYAARQATGRQEFGRRQVSAGIPGDSGASGEGP